MADKERIGVIGLGIMGKPMARNLMTAGHEVVVYDLFPEPVEELVTDGAVLGTSPADVASKSDITVVMVQNSPQSTTVALGENGIIEAADKGQLVVDMSSIAPLVSQKIGKELAEAGIDRFTAEGRKAADMSGGFVPNLGLDIARNPFEMFPQRRVTGDPSMEADMIDEFFLVHAPGIILVEDFRPGVEKIVEGF